MAFLVINQNMLAGNNFGGVAPEDASGPAEPIDTPPARTFNDLVNGGLYEFLTDTEKYALQVERLVLDMGDAVSWVLAVRTTNGDGVTVDVTLVDSTGAGGNTYESFDTIGKIMPGEELVLTSSGATTAMRAQISASKWSS